MLSFVFQINPVSRFCSVCAIFCFFGVQALGAAQIFSVAFKDVVSQELLHVAIGADGDMFRSVNSGDSYSQVLSGDLDGRMIALAYSGETMVSVGEAGIIYRSTDKGQTWSRAYSPSILGDLLDVEADNSGNWVAVGHDGVNGVVLISNNDGQSWSFSQTHQTISAAVLPPQGDWTHIYVDALYGNDMSDGLSESTAKRSLGAIGPVGVNTVIHLARGSEWREKLQLGSHVEVRAYGEGGAPVINAADLVPNADFDNVAGYPNVYATVWQLDPDGNVLSDVVQILENGEPLKWAGSIAACDSIPGSFYEDGTSTSLSRNVYVHPRDSTSPDTDGKIYELAKRDYALKMGDHCKVFDIVTKNNARNDGSLVAGNFIYAARISPRNGTKHIMLTRGHTYIKDSSFLHTNNRNQLIRSGQLVVFDQILNNYEIVIKGTTFEQINDVSRAAYAFVSHGSGGGRNEAVVFQNCRFNNFSLAHSEMGMNSYSALGVWSFNCEFNNCDAIWSGRWQYYKNTYVNCYFERLSIAAGRTTLFSGAGSGNPATGELSLLGCRFDTREARLIQGTFRALNIQYNTINGVDTSQTSQFLATMDFVDGDGAAGKSFRFTNNLVVGYRKPWRYRTASILNDFESLVINYNAYINYNSIGQFERNFSNLSFSQWQSDVDVDWNSLSMRMDDASITWEEGNRRPRVSDPQTEAGAEAAASSATIFDEIQEGKLTELRAVDWSAGGASWVSVGSMDWGLCGAGIHSADGSEWEYSLLPSEAPRLNTVSVDTEGLILAAGEESTILLSDDEGSSYRLLYHYLGGPDFYSLANGGAGKWLAVGESDTFLCYDNEAFSFLHMPSLDALSSSYVAWYSAGDFFVAGDYGEDPMLRVFTLPLHLDINLSPNSETVGKVNLALSNAQRGGSYALYVRCDLNDEDGWTEIEGSRFVASGSSLWWDVDMFASEDMAFFSVFESD